MVAEALETFAVRTLKEACDNRGYASVGVDANGGAYNTETKWAGNLRAIIPENTRPSVAGFDKAWRESDAKEKWSSRAKSASTANAVKTAHDFCEDVVFRGGTVPFRIGVYGKNDAPVEETQQIEEHIERHMDGRAAKCDLIPQLMRGWDDSTTYGVRFFHGILVADATEPSGQRPAAEEVNPYECFWDMDNDGPLSEGEYFNRRQRKNRWRVLRWAGQVNAASQKNYGKNQIDIDLLRASFAKSNSGEGQGTPGTTGTSNQTGTPETDDLMWTNKNEVIDELWAWVPRDAVVKWNERYPDSIQLAQHVVEPMGEEGDSTSDVRKDDDRVWVMMTVSNGSLVGLLPEPGDLPYRMTYWHRISGCRDGLGIADMNSTNQCALDGLVRALENDLKTCRKLVIYDGSKFDDPARIEEMLQKPIGYLAVNAGLSGDVGKVMTATNMPSSADMYVKGLEFFQSMADLDTGFARVQMGQRSEGDNTAFELKQRLDNSGRHCGTKIRALDADIVWILSWMLDMDQKLGNIELPADMEIRGGGFRAFSRQLSLYSTMFALLQLAEQFPDIKERMNIGWVLAELCESQGIDPEKFWINEQEFQGRQQAKAESPEAQAQQQQLQLSLEALRAKIDKDDASAQKLLAETQAIAAGIGHAQSKLQLDRAKGAVDIASKMRQANTMQDRRNAVMEPSAVVKKAA